MEFTDLPREVIDDNLLKFLSWNDLLRLRRVCIWTKRIIDGYLRVNPNRAPEIEIQEGSQKTLEDFLEMDIPTTKLFLNNSQSGYYFYKTIEEETQRQFLEDYGGLIKNLRVAQLTLRPFGRELDFLSGMKSLKSFEAGYFSHGKKDDDDEWGAIERSLLKLSKNDQRLTTFRIPKVFYNLEWIRIGQDEYFRMEFDVLLRVEQTLLSCPRLKIASLPYDSTFWKTSPTGAAGDPLRVHTALANAFDSLQNYVMERPNDVYGTDSGKEQLQVYDFRNYHQEFVPYTIEAPLASHESLVSVWIGSQIFLPIVKEAVLSGLKLKNVGANWFGARFKADFGNEYASPEIGFPVVSLVGLDPTLMEMTMPNLEKITIPLTSACVPGIFPRPEWPSLKSVDITVDGIEGHAWNMVKKTSFADVTMVVGQPTQYLYKFLFGDGIVCGNMSELIIKFVEGKGKEEVAVPKVEEIVRSCQNLKRIELGNWMGTNKQLVELWGGLLRLEEICIENCMELGNVAFVGKDVKNPVFLKLKNLKKLSLKGLDKMPKITDTLFGLVLAKMKLKELVITSEKPVDKVTRKGLNALKEGPFARTIERFPFCEWSLADVTGEEFGEMEKKFRSYDMI